MILRSLRGQGAARTAPATGPAREGQEASPGAGIRRRPGRPLFCAVQRGWRILVQPVTEAGGAVVSDIPYTGRPGFRPIEQWTMAAMGDYGPGRPRLMGVATRCRVSGTGAFVASRLPVRNIGRPEVGSLQIGRAHV